MDNAKTIIARLKGFEKTISHRKRSPRPFRLSLRWKLAFPIMILVSLMLLLLFRTTFRTVRALVTEHTESRLKAIAEVFAETVKVPLILRNQQVLIANIEWMAKRPDVVEVRVEDSDGVIVGGAQSTYTTLPQSTSEDRKFLGVKRISQDSYYAAVRIRAHDRTLGRVVILFSQRGFEQELRQIFEERLMVAFILGLILTILTACVTWLATLPLMSLEKTVKQILAGDLTARARIYSYDEIQDLGEAFNEMVARLARSLDNLRSRTEALEESEEKYRLIVENANDIIFTMNPNGDLMVLNKGFSGCNREEILQNGLNLFLSLHDETSREKFQEALITVSREKKAVTNVPTNHIHRVNHTEIYYLTNLTPILDYEENVKFIQGVMRDVTELRRIELMKESLIRDVAHELKTPTAKFEMAVNWFEKEMDKNKEIEKYRHVVDMLKNNTDRLMRTIMSIMDLSKLESGMVQVAMTKLNLNEVLEQVRQDMDSLCKKKNLTLEASFSRNSLMMNGDRDMLYRLFVNLISNSIKFTELGKVSIQSAQKGGKILVTVADTGMGIEPEDLEKVFDKFYQKTASTIGIGVGLAISRDIVVLHQGKIWAESEGLGKGAVFKVEFPFI